ncbi:MAG: hypothetical protein ACJ8AW_34435 [Rhodopila sp.]
MHLAESPGLAIRASDPTTRSRGAAPAGRRADTVPVLRLIVALLALPAAGCANGSVNRPPMGAISYYNPTSAWPSGGGGKSALGEFIRTWMAAHPPVAAPPVTFATPAETMPPALPADQLDSPRDKTPPAFRPQKPKPHPAPPTSATAANHAPASDIPPWLR